MGKFPALNMLEDFQAMVDTIAEGMRQHYRDNGSEPLNILEAGCGSKCDLNTSGIEFTLTGVDIYEQDIELRKAKHKDLDIGIVGDLRTVSLDENAYDIVYSAYVLEHIAGAEQVLDNFVTWLKPGGRIFLVIPDRDGCYAFYTRLMPFWSHEFVKRFIFGDKSAGSPGMGPFPVVYDKVVSRKGIRDYCQANGLNINTEYGLNGYVTQRTVRAAIVNVLLWLTSVISFGRLSAKHAGLVYIIEKPGLGEE
jgi:SAM-dependent methyltransferase